MSQDAMPSRAPTDPGAPPCPHHDLITEAFGRSGKNGRVGNMEKRMKRIENEVADIKAMTLKLIIWVSVAAGGSTAAVGTAFKLISG